MKYLNFQSKYNMELTQELFESLKGKANGIFDENRVSTYLEVGVREGNTFKTRTPLVTKHAVALDCWDLYEKDSQNDMGRQRSEAFKQYENLINFYNDNPKIEIVRSFSNNPIYINRVLDNYFDVIFIDGDHSYEGVKEDLNNWWSKCNTLFCGHDYMLKETVWNGVRCGVKEAVDEFVEEHKSEIKQFRLHTESHNPTWFIWKN